MAAHIEMRCQLGATLEKARWATDVAAGQISYWLYEIPALEGPNAWPSNATRHYPPVGGWAAYEPTTANYRRCGSDWKAGRFDHSRMVPAHMLCHSDFQAWHSIAPLRLNDVYCIVSSVFMLRYERDAIGKRGERGGRHGAVGTC